MPKSTITVANPVGKTEALSRLKNILSEAKDQHGGRISDLQENWTDNGGTFSFRAMGFKISGVLKVTDTDVEIVGEYPFAAVPFRGTIESTLRDRAERLLKP